MTLLATHAAINKQQQQQQWGVRTSARQPL
jgi:hypothetical protein